MFSFYFIAMVLAFSSASRLPGPQVYVVTSAPRSSTGTGRSAPFYYHSWLRRSDTSNDLTTTTTTTTPKTPDLIFAEFESDDGSSMKKSIRKLLEKERIEIKTSTAKPIYVPDDEPIKQSTELNVQNSDDYFAMYNNMFNNPSSSSVHAPVYMPSTTTTTPKSTTKAENSMNVENIWHIIDNEKHSSGDWQEVSIDDSNSKGKSEENGMAQHNFPSVAASHETVAENESRGIRTDSNFNFPYVNLKTVQMKNSKKPTNKFSPKKTNNMFVDLNNFDTVHNPVRGEAEDGYKINPQQIDRYNPAQPYLPGDYGGQSKKVNPNPAATKTVSSLVPPPPPPLPPAADDSLPPPPSYESFPPYFPDSPSSPDVDLQPPSTYSKFPPTASDSEMDMSSDIAPAMDLGYKYKVPANPTFLPTLPPLTKPISGYSYPKPMVQYSAPPNDGGYTYNKPALQDPTPMKPNKPISTGYTYDKPAVPFPPAPGPSYGDHHHNSDYPELIYDKPHGVKDDFGMQPPPPPPADVEPDDSGFPHDFPGDLKYHHDFDDHDFYHYHHHEHDEITTEMPRVNRYSYYYLGKKLYYLPLYFSIYFVVYVGALIIKAVLRHKIVYPNSWRPNDTTAGFFSKRSIDTWEMSSENMHELTGFVTKAIAEAAEKYMNRKDKSS